MYDIRTGEDEFTSSMRHIDKRARALRIGEEIPLRDGRYLTYSPVYPPMITDVQYTYATGMLIQEFYKTLNRIQAINLIWREREDFRKYEDAVVGAEIEALEGQVSDLVAALKELNVPVDHTNERP